MKHGIGKCERLLEKCKSLESISTVVATQKYKISRLEIIKWAVIVSWVIGAILLAVPSSLSKTDAPQTSSAQNPNDYVGSDTCMGCHEDIFKSFSKTSHSRLAKANWKGEHQGCESCHGPGKAHVDGGGDKTKIRTFEHETAKQVSGICLTCHAGREEHNNFIRGEHWRNDVGCTDCHSPHISSRSPVEPKGDGSSSLQPVGPFAAHASDFVPRYMLKRHEVLLCMRCHSETKSQFNMP